MPSQHGAEMPEDRQQFVEINVVKSSAMKKTEKRPVQASIKKNIILKKLTIKSNERLEIETVIFKLNLSIYFPIYDFSLAWLMMISLSCTCGGKDI